MDGHGIVKERVWSIFGTTKNRCLDGNPYGRTTPGTPYDLPSKHRLQTFYSIVELILSRHQTNVNTLFL